MSHHEFRNIPEIRWKYSGTFTQRYTHDQSKLWLGTLRDPSTMDCIFIKKKTLIVGGEKTVKITKIYKSKCLMSEGRTRSY